ncbi:MAG: prolyl oligopeptidase family serine peptidase, partial [Pontiellaceae bacterium]|nr:prolyl oligopeptidase family serine peptidase [Pontiellaceae bacterium]
LDNKAIESVLPEEDPFALQSLPSNRFVVRFGANGPESAIIFINITKEPVQLFWADSAGIKHPYAVVQPGASYRQHTYSGHAWIAGDHAFIAQDEPGLAYIGIVPSASRSTPPRRQPRQVTQNRGEAPKWQVRFRDNNLFVRSTQENNNETQLTSDGTVEQSYSGPTFFSPDGRYLIAMRTTPGDQRTIDLVEAAPRDQLQPKTVTISYAKPGDRIAQSKPCLFDLQTMKPIPVDDALFPNPWDITDCRWAPDGSQFYFVYNERGHQVARLLSLNPQTGAVKVLAEETSDTFIDWTNKLNVRYLNQTEEALWMSQRTGWNHLYLIDLKTGENTPITSGEWVLRNIVQIDEAAREIIFRAGGIVPDQDPYYLHYARVGFDGSSLTLLTEGNGTHSISWSPQQNYYVDSWSRVDQPPVHELRRISDGGLIKELGKADASALLALHPYLPEPFVAKGRDGETDMYGVIYRPSDFDPEKKYPVVEEIYAGPQDQHVPKAFSPWRSRQRLAELGFIVVQIDGMGTNWRSKEFHDVCYKNLKDAGFPDRIAWLKAAAEQYPYMDLTRVGIYGTSAGGQNAMRAVLDHADFYKAAAADSGCHDNLMDKMWWNEQWMGWPVDESYIESSNMEDAHKLGGKLLLTVGMMDSNVDPSSTLQVVEELIKADKDFELMVFPSSGHGAGMGAYGTRLREQFFIRYLQ